jgi:phospholipid/cholesterol/gamma-HCH transport system permease protein
VGTQAREVRTTATELPTSRAREWFMASPAYESLQSMGGMGSLLVRTIGDAVRPPFTWVGDAVAEASTAFRRCLLPLFIAHAVYLIGYGIILFSQVIASLGLSEREAGAIESIWARECSTWMTAMVFAGVVGSAITADLGARKIREELEALDVMGVKQIRALVVPRVIGLTIASPVLAIVSLGFVVSLNYVLGPGALGYSHGVYLHDVGMTVIPLDLLLPLAVKNMVIGFFVGLVACHKGLTCRRGAEGVGRAVNQTVVLTFFGIWLFNSFFNLAYLSIFPDVAVLRG